MYDLLLPETDAGVFAQFALLFIAAGISGWFARSNKDILLLIVGMTLLAAGLMAIRAIH